MVLHNNGPRSSVTAHSLLLLLLLQEEYERRYQEAKVVEANRLQVLEKLAASVPYAEACANAEAKLDHITGGWRDKLISRALTLYGTPIHGGLRPRSHMYGAILVVQ